MSASATAPALAPTEAAHPRWPRHRVEWLCTAMGAWGVATGFAVFILLWTHGRPHPLVFVAGLLVAALIAYVAEILRDLIKEGVAVPAITGPRVVVTVLLLMIIELVVHAGTGLVQLAGPGHEAASTQSELQQIVAPIAGGESGFVTEIAVLTVAWMIVGAVIARRLARVVFQKAATTRAAMLIGAREGILGGLVAAPLCALGCLLVLRWAGMVREMVFHGEAWSRDMHFSLTHTAFDPPLVVALKLPAWLWLGGYHVGRMGHGAGAALLAVVAVVTGWWCWRHRSARLLRFVALALVLLVLAPLTDDLDRLGQVAVLAMVIWIVPGFMLGVVAPLLRGAGDEPRLWGMIAFGAAALLTLVTLLKFASPWCYALACSLVLIGLLFFRGAPLREYWPLAAAAMASMVSGVMVFVERATFLGVFSQVHAIHQLSIVRPDPLLANLKGLMDLTRPDAFLDDDEMRELAAQARTLAGLPTDRQVDRLDEITAMLDRLQSRWRSARAEHLRGVGGGSLWGMLKPGGDLEQLYRDLADLVEHPPQPDDREHAFGELLARVDVLIKPEQETAAVLARLREREERHKAELEAAVQSGTASEDMVRYGPAIGAIAAELFSFSKLAPDARRAPGEALRTRLADMLNAEGVAVTPTLQRPSHVFATLGTAFETQQARRAARLVDLWQQLEREMVQSGSGGFVEPRTFSEDPATLPWRKPKPVLSLSGEPIKVKTRLDWLEEARATIDRQRLELAAEQEPPAQTPAVREPAATTATGHGAPAHDPSVAAAERKTEASSEPAGTIAPENRFAMSIMFPNAVRMARLAEIREQLLAVKKSAEELKHWWSATPAVLLELSLVGSFGFWVTVALLAAWSLTEQRPIGHGAAPT